MKYAFNHNFEREYLARRRARRLRRFLAGLLLFIALAASNTATAANPTKTNGNTESHPADSSPTDIAGTNSVADDSAATNQVNVMDDTYKLAIGDQLSYRVWEDEDDPKVLPVTDSGDLEVPYLGRYPSVGKTCKQLAQEIKTELEKKYYYKATVVIAVDSKPKSRGKVYLAGAVGAAGPEDISGDETLTVSKAILRAGGLSGFADGKKVKVTRSTGDKPGDEKTFIVNVTKVLEDGKTEDDLTLQPGDFIFVPERVIRF